MVKGGLGEAARMGGSLEAGGEDRAGHSGPGPAEQLVTVGDLVLDLPRREVTLGGVPLGLTSLEFDLLAYLASHPGWVFSPEQVLAEVWGHRWVGDSRLVSVHVANLRRKLGDIGAQPRWIQNVRGVGYKLVRPAPPDARPPVRIGPGHVRTAAECRPQLAGRDREMVRVTSALNAAADGVGGALLVCGEPGIGKTRLAEEAGLLAEESGLAVAWGRCQELEGVPAYWPWLQVLRAIAAELADDELRKAAGVGEELGLLLPELRPRLGIREAGLAGLGSQHRVFMAASDFLMAAARLRPRLVVLDDLQWADRSSLGLLEVLAPQLRGAPLLLLATVREGELGRDHPLRASLASLARSPTERLDLVGLDREGVARVVEDTSGSAAQEPVVDFLYQETQGNPFYVTEVVRLLAAENRLSRAAEMGALPLPATVREVVSRRLARLSDGCRDLLGLCALAGRSFGLSLVTPAAELPPGQLVALLGEALGVRLLEEEDGPTRLRFSHPLIHETIVREIGHVRRLQLHARLGQTLSSEAARSATPSYVEAAHHFYRAAPLGVAREAAEYGLLAGEQLLEAFAYEAAEEYLVHALDALELLPEPDEALVCRIFLALGESRKSSGKLDLGDETFARAAAVAGRAGLIDEFARAALGFELMLLPPFFLPPRAIALLEQAVERLPDDHPLVARCLACLGRGIGQDLRRREESAALLDRADTIARGTADPFSLASVLVAKALVLGTPDNLEERLAWAREASILGRAFGNRFQQSQALYAQAAFWWEGFWWEAGEGEEALRAVAERRRLADATRLPWQQWTASISLAGVALQEARLEDAKEGLQLVPRWTEAQKDMLDAALAFMDFYPKREQGREAELDERIQHVLVADPYDPGWACRLAQIRIATGRTEEARAILDRLAAHDFIDLPWDGRWLVFCALLAEVIHELADARRAKELYGLLSPYTDRVVAAHYQAFGPVGHFLGLLGMTMGDIDGAEAHFAAALEVEERLRMRLWRLHTQVSMAEVGACRGTADSLFRAEETLKAVEAEATPLGLGRVLTGVARVRSMLARSPA